MRHWRIEQWLSDPIAAQREVLQDLVTHGQYTDFGRKYGFSKLFTVRKFKEAVPIHEYEDLKPYIDRIMQGEENVLWNTPVSWFAKSSGTTNDKSKFIPITQESLEDCHFQSAKDVLTLYYQNRTESDLLTGKGLVIGGSHQISQVNEEIHYGDLSAVLLQNTPVWANWIKTPELSIALMDEWEEKIERLAQSTIREDVTSISGVPTWTLILIKRILEITGKSTLKEVWPNLELYIHGGVSFTPYKEQFKKLIGEGCTYLEMYNASEG
ncbi:MAG: GH3 auxin-responsive promoter family protein, partial [Sediminibacterium sp.]|nr:GH3 auxin-responsive promoter family protein [Sediminibacterium sp.]